MNDDIQRVRESISAISGALFEGARELCIKHGTSDVISILESMTDDEFKQITAHGGRVRKIYLDLMRQPENSFILELANAAFAAKIST